MSRRIVKSKSLRIMGIGLTATAVLGIAPAANAATPAQWRVIKSVSEGQDYRFSAVVATGKDSGWAFQSSLTGGKPVAYERTGASTWKTVPFPGSNGEYIRYAAAGSIGDVPVWAFGIVGNKTQAFQLVNGKWELRKTLPGLFFEATVANADGSLMVYLPDAAYRFNGATWTETRESINNGYAIDSSDGWTFSGTTVTHVATEPKTTKKSWNLKSLLPAKTRSNDPGITGVYANAYSDSNVYVFANSNAGGVSSMGALLVLHYNGHAWTKVGSYAHGVADSVTPDNSGGLWISDSSARVILHLSAGKLTATPLPSAGTNAANIPIAVSAIPILRSSEALAVSDTLPDSIKAPAYGEILQYGG